MLNYFFKYLLELIVVMTIQITLSCNFVVVIFWGNLNWTEEFYKHVLLFCKYYTDFFAFSLIPYFDKK